MRECLYVCEWEVKMRHEKLKEYYIYIPHQFKMPKDSSKKEYVCVQLLVYTYLCLVLLKALITAVFLLGIVDFIIYK